MWKVKMNQIEKLRNELIEVNNVLNLPRNQKERIAQKAGYSLSMLHRILKGNRLIKNTPKNLQSLKKLNELFNAEKSRTQQLLEKI
jgi:hypothetical protein